MRSTRIFRFWVGTKEVTGCHQGGWCSGAIVLIILLGQLHKSLQHHDWAVRSVAPTSEYGLTLVEMTIHRGIFAWFKLNNPFLVDSKGINVGFILLHSQKKASSLSFVVVLWSTKQQFGITMFQKTLAPAPEHGELDKNYTMSRMFHKEF